jgi:drug/metabolite transporter (DMT)-like permease
VTTLTLCVVLLAAGLHATWNALVKSGDVITRMALVQAMASLCALPFVLVLPPPDRASWPYLLGSIIVHQGYFACLMLGYRAGDLSQVYPIARGSAPLLVAAGAFVFAGEALRPPGLAAVLVISLAIMSLVAAGPSRDGTGAPTVFALATGVTIAGYTLLDGLGGRLAGDVARYVAWLFALEGLPLATFVLVRRWRVVRSTLRQELPAGALGGAFSFLAYGAVIWAMSVTPMTYISALRETSVILAALIGTRLLREPMGARRIAAATAVALGVVLLQISGSV